MDKKALKQLAIDITDEKVFGTWNITARNSSNLLGMIFMPLLFIDEETKEQIKKLEFIHFYEYMDKAGPRAINGYPMFTSMKCLTREDSAVVFRMCKKLQEQKDKFLEEKDPVRPEEQPMLWEEE